MGVRGGFCCSVPQYGGVGGGGGRGGTHTHTHTHTHTGTHTGTHTQMLHLPFSDLPLKKCPNRGGCNSGNIVDVKSHSGHMMFWDPSFMKGKPT